MPCISRVTCCRGRHQADDGETGQYSELGDSDLHCDLVFPAIIVPWTELFR